MTTFAHGTDPGYANAYTNWFYGGGFRSGQPKPRRQDYGMPGYSGPRQQPYTGTADSQAAQDPTVQYRTWTGRQDPITGAVTQQFLDGDKEQVKFSAPAGIGNVSGGRPKFQTYSPGKPSPQAGKVNPYNPGKAQPVQQPSYGTPYGQPNGRRQIDTLYDSGFNQYQTPTNQTPRGFAPNTPLASLPASAWGSPIRHDSNGDGVDDRLAGMQRPTAPRQTIAESRGAPPGGTYFDDMVPIGAGGSGTASDPRFTQQYSSAGNLAYARPDQRPQPFQAAYGQIGGGYSDQPNVGQRDAFISNINNQLGQMQQQSWARPGSQGAPQFDFGQMWGQAGDMVQQGWQNPLAGLFGGASPAASARLLPGASPPPLPQGFIY